MKQRYLSITIGMLAMLWVVRASAQFKLTAEIRPRAEFRNGFKSPIEKRQDPAFFIEQRTRLNAGYQSGKFDVMVSVQDVRVWGATSQVYKSDPALFNVYEAYGTYKFSTKHHISVGRIALDYDNARFLGNLDWAQQGRSHDLLKYSYLRSGFQLDVGAAFNQDTSVPEFKKLTGTYYSGVNNYKTMQYAWAHMPFEKGKLSLLFLNNGVQYAPDSVYFSQTIGTYAVPQIWSSSLELEFYYQGGKDGNGRTLSAYMAAASWSFLKGKPVGLSAGIDYLSGDNPETTTNEAFSPFYGTNHKFYGFMDYFFVGNGHGNKGLADLNLKAKFKTGEKSALIVHTHQFFATAPIPDPASAGSGYASSLGTEIDLVFNASLGEGVKILGGYSQMFQSDSMDFIKGKTNTRGIQNWAWAMLVLKPVLFETSK